MRWKKPMLALITCIVLSFILLGFAIRIRAGILPDPLAGPGQIEKADSAAASNKLFVLVPGMSGSWESLHNLRDSLKTEGDVLRIVYPGAYTNANPDEIAQDINAAIKTHAANYQEIVL